jgi:serologically defined colon cancer antigen 8
MAEMRALETEKKSVIAGIELEIRGWEEQFHNRGPRPEDLDRIRKLEELIRERTQAYEKGVGETRRIQTDCGFCAKCARCAE